MLNHSDLEKYDMPESKTVSAFVRDDYRNAEIFHRYGIDFCCGANRPLAEVCREKSLEVSEILGELDSIASGTIHAKAVDFGSWELGFLTRYIINVHHRYIQKALPVAIKFLEKFTRGHEKKYPYLPELVSIAKKLQMELDIHQQEEEAVIFPYILQIEHAAKNRESYAPLLVRTLKKPVENLMHSEHQALNFHLNTMRRLTNDYSFPENTCVTHKLAFQKLQEVDRDLTQHIFLETKILFPKAIQIEKQLLDFNG
jgi:regulator of cell morphogenesis and NO signaling